MARDKKFFAPELRSYKNNLNARWRVEYWEPTHNGNRAKRVVVYGNINEGTTIAQRQALAEELICRLRLEAPKEARKNLLQLIIEEGAIDWRPKTQSAYSTVANTFTTFLGKKPPEKATENDVKQFLQRLNKEGASKNTLAKYRNTLFSLYERAKKQVRNNPAAAVPQIKKEAAISLHFFSDAQIQKFRQHPVKPQLWLSIQLLYYCFIRPGEQRLLKIGNINFEYGFIEIPGAISKNKKTEKVQIPQVLLEDLLWLQKYPPGYYVLSNDGRPGKEPVSPKWINYHHTALLRALEITGHYSFYSWKHTGVVKAARGGVNIKDLQLQLRHHSLDMVNEYLKQLGVIDSIDIRLKFPPL